jgi:Thiol-disulfide isomerase and thioredoxins
MTAAAKLLLFVILLTHAITAAGATDYPAINRKDLGADRDYRGKKAPPLNVQQWLTKAPSYGDKVVLVDFWATWCGPCCGLIPELNEWQKKLGKDLIVIGISNEDAPTIRDFMREEKFAYSVGIDQKARAERSLGVVSIPHCMVYTPDGVVRWQGLPTSRRDPLNEQVLKQIIAAYREGKR